MAASYSWLSATMAGTAGGITLLTYAGLSNSTPGTTGAGELPATPYARQTNTNSAPTNVSNNAVSSNSAGISWSIAASTSGIGWVTYWGGSGAATVGSGTYETDVVLTSAVSFSSAGTLSAASGALTLTASQTA